LVTCYLRYVIDPYKLDDFETYVLGLALTRGRARTYRPDPAYARWDYRQPLAHIGPGAHSLSLRIAGPGSRARKRAASMPSFCRPGVP